MEEEIYDQAAIMGLFYELMSPESRKAIFGEPKEESKYPLESYKFMILDLSEDAQTSDSDRSLST